MAQPETLQDKVTRWYGLKAEAARLAAEEASLRQEIAALFTQAPEAGSARLHLGHGKDLKLTTKVNYTVDQDALARLHNVLPEHVRAVAFRTRTEAVAGAVAPMLSPKSVLAPDAKRALAECVTARPGLPSLEVVDVKKRG